MRRMKAPAHADGLLTLHRLGNCEQTLVLRIKPISGEQPGQVRIAGAKQLLSALPAQQLRRLVHGNQSSLFVEDERWIRNALQQPVDFNLPVRVEWLGPASSLN